MKPREFYDLVVKYRQRERSYERYQTKESYRKMKETRKEIDTEIKRVTAILTSRKQ